MADIKVNDGWILKSEQKPPREGKGVLCWFYSDKRQMAVVGYGNEYGYFDLDGTGIAFSRWQPLTPPNPPKENKG